MDVSNVPIFREMRMISSLSMPKMCIRDSLGAVFAPARDMVNAGVPVAMATDFNPGSCPCLNMQFVINLGCLKYRLTPEEVLTAVTLNGAAAIDMADKVGTVEAGKLGDLSLIHI